MVPEMQAAERRIWNSKPSEDTRVTYGDCEVVDALGPPLLMVYDLLIVAVVCAGN
jgi:hypothetical protein